MSRPGRAAINLHAGRQGTGTGLEEKGCMDRAMRPAAARVEFSRGLVGNRENLAIYFGLPPWRKTWSRQLRTEADPCTRG